MILDIDKRLKERYNNQIEDEEINVEFIEEYNDIKR